MLKYARIPGHILVKCPSVDEQIHKVSTRDVLEDKVEVPFVLEN